MINLSRSFLIVVGFVALVVVMLLGLSTGIAVTQSRAIANIEDLSTQVSNAEKTVAAQAVTETAAAATIEALSTQVSDAEKTVTARADADATATAISKDRAFALNDTISIGLQPTISVAIYGNFVAPSEIDLREKSFTIAAWAKREGNGSFFIIGQGTNEGNKGLHFGFRGGNQRFTCGFWYNDLDLDTPDQQEDVGEWHHWACTVQVDLECRGQKPCRTIYKDGKEVTTTPSGAKSGDYQGSGPLMIGNSPLQTNSEGSVAGVAVYDRVLNPEEIRSLMEITRPPEVTPTPIE